MAEAFRTTVVGGAVLALAVTTLTATPQVEAQQTPAASAVVTGLTVDTPTIDGPGTVPLDDLPRSAFATGASGSAHTASTSLSDVPLGAIDLEASPLGAIGTSSVDLGTLPLGAIAADGVAAAGAILDQVLLSSIPLHRDGGWEAILAGTPLAGRPLQTITLGQVLEDGTTAVALASTPLGAIDLSGTPLGAIPLGAIALGALPLGAIDLPNEVEVCDLFPQDDDITACKAVVTGGGTALELSLAGVDVGATLGALPLGAIPLGAIGLQTSPLGAIPLGAIDVADSPLGAIPLGAIDWASTPLGAIPLGAIPLGAIATKDSPLGAIPLGAIPLGAIAAESAPLGAIPLGAIPLGAIATKDSPLGAIPLGAIPLGAIATAESPLGAIPLGAIGVAASPLGAIPLGAIPLGAIATEASPLGAIPLGAIDVGGSPLGAITLPHVTWSTSPLGAIPVTDTDVQLSGVTLGELGGLDQIPLRHVNGAADVLKVLVGDVTWSATDLGALGLDALATEAGADLLTCGGPDEQDCTTATIADAVAAGEIPSTADLGDVVGALVDTADAGALGDLVAQDPPAVASTTSAAGLLPLADAGARPDVPLTLAAFLGDSLISGSGENIHHLLSRMAILRTADEAEAFALTGNVGSLVAAMTAGTSLTGQLRDLLDDLQQGATFGGDATVADLLDDLVGDDDPGSPPLLTGALWQLLAAVEDTEFRLQGELHDLLAGLVGDGETDLGYHEMTGSLYQLLALVPDGTALTGDLEALLQHVNRDEHVLGGALEDLLSVVGGDLPAGTVLSLLLGLLAGVDTGLTLSDVLLSLMPTSDWNWEAIDLSDPEVREVLAGASGVATVTMSVDVASTTDLELSLELPGGLSLEPGGTVTLPDATVVDLGAPVINTNRATWDLQLAAGTHQVAVTVRGGALIGDFPMLAWTEVDQVVQDPPARASLVVSSPTEVPGGAPLVVASGSLAIGHVGQSGDHDTYAIDVAAGQRLSLRLGNLAADLDMVLYRQDPVAPLRQAPVESRLPIDEPPVTLTPSQVAVTADSQADVHVPDGKRAHSISAQRARTDERIETGPLDEGRWLVRVSGYNGAFSSLPYTLRVRLADGPDLGACPARFASSDQAALAAGTTPQPALAGSTDTLFLVHPSRLAAAFGQQQADAVVAAVQQLAGGSAATTNDVDAGILFLDGAGGTAELAAVADAYGAWDDEPCDPERANDVVRAIGDLLDTTAQGLDLEHLVVVGSDDIVPFGRVADVTTLSNEQDHATAVADHETVAGSLAAGRVLTDDVYADAVPIAVGERELFTPEVAIGRLVDTPDQILSSLASYETSGGVLPVSGGFTSGYDFLTDGGERIGQELTSLLGEGKVTDLLSETWTADDLSTALVGAAAGAPADTTLSLAEIAAVNAHFDQHRLLPALGDSTGDESDLLTTALLRTSVGAGDADALAGRLLFSMGCHAGLSLPGVGDGNDDWADLFADTGALWVGNTGYGYGDTELVALSEDLMVRFADALDRTGTVGTALARAKAAYVRDLGIVSPYDEKALMQSTLYGLPFYRLDVPAPATPPPGPTSVVPTPIAGTGLARSSVSFDLSNHLGGAHGDALGDGQWYSVDGQTTSVPFRPIQPQVSSEITADPTTELVATGALLTDLTSQDEIGFVPRYFRPTVDLSTTEPSQRMGDTAFPAALQRVTTSVAPDGGTRQELVVIPGQFRGSGAGDSGTQRLFTQVTADVLYAPASTTDHLPPAITEVQSIVVGGGAPYVTGVAVRAADAASDIHRVVVTYTGGDSGEWSSFDLPSYGGGLYVGFEFVDHAQLDYFVQVVDTAGNVAVSTNKGRFFGALAVKPAKGPLVDIGAVTLPGVDTRVNGWFNTTPVQVVLGAPPQDVLPYYLVSRDGGAPTLHLQGETIEVTEEGVHRLRIEWIGDPAQFAELTLPIDETPPIASTATATPPPNPAGWHRDDVTVTLTAGEDPGPIGSGTDLLRWWATGATEVPETNTKETSTTVLVTAEGRTSIHYLSADRASNTETERTFPVRLDRTRPRVLGPQVATDAAGTPRVAASGTGWYHLPPPITTSTTDPLLEDGPDDPFVVSGIASLRVIGTKATAFTVSAAGTPEDGATVGTDTGMTVLGEGQTVLTATGTDVADNTFTRAGTFHVDTTAPTSTLAVAAERNVAGWYNDALEGERTPTITAVDEHPAQDPDAGRFPSGIGAIGVAATADPSIGGLALPRENRRATDSDEDGWTDNEVAFDASTWEVATPQPITQEGITELQWGARDRAELAEDGVHSPDDSFPLTHSQTLRVDVTPPTITVNAVPFPAAARPELEDRVDTVLTSPSRDDGAVVFNAVPLPDSVVDPATPPTYHLRQAVPVQFACADDVSTVLSCTSQFVDPTGVAHAGPVVGSTAVLDTSAPGLWDFRVTATDVAGNQHVFSYPYRSAYRLVDDDRTCQKYRADKEVNAGSNLALRLAVCDVDGVAPENPTVQLQAVSVDGGSAPPDSGDANPERWFRWDETAGHHVFNLDTTGLTAGQHTIEVRIDADPATPPAGPPALLYELHIRVRE